MKIKFVGTGEAVDGRRNNTSLLIDSSILLDCGYNIAHALVDDWLEDRIDTVYISHFHGDHFAGTSALLLLIAEENRTAPLEFIGAPGIEEVITRNFDNHYGKNFLEKLNCDVTFTEISEESVIERNGYKLTFLSTIHSDSSYAVRIAGPDGQSLVYSADTAPLHALIDFSADADLLVHECYEVKGEHRVHCSAETLGPLLNGGQVPQQLAIVHVCRHVDRSDIGQVLAEHYKGRIILPDDGEEITLLPGS